MSKKLLAASSIAALLFSSVCLASVPGEDSTTPAEMKVVFSCEGDDAVLPTDAN